MIGYIKGKVTIIDFPYIIIENNGVGYKIQVNEKTISKTNTKQDDLQIFTFMNVKEDDISLFGFLDMQELEIFNKLITVSGVGPKAALSLLNSLTPAQIVLAIVSSDIKALSSGQGIGKKIAQRLAMELKEKVDLSVGQEISEKAQTLQNEDNKEINDAVDALIALGFSKMEILTVVNKIQGKDTLNSSKIISLALKDLAR